MSDDTRGTLAPTSESDHQAHIEIRGRRAITLTMVTSRRAGISSADAKRLIELLADHAGRWIEGRVRERETGRG